MSAKLIKALLAHAMALFAIVLLLLLTVGMGTAEGLAVDFLRTSQASHTLNTDLALASRQKRYLRSAADVTTSDRSRSGGPRRLTISLAGFERLPASLHYNMVKTFYKLRVQWWLYWQRKKTPYDAFKSLQLDKVKGSLFKNPKFPAWKYFVEATKSKEEDATRVMFDTLDTVFKGDAALVKVLGQAKGSHGDTVQSLRKYLFARWKKQGHTVLKLGKLLGVEKIENDKLPGSPEFTMLGAYIIESDFSMSKIDPFVTRREEIPLTRALAVTIAAEKDSFFIQSLLYDTFRTLSTLEKSSPREKFIEWGLSKAGDPLKTPLGRAWVDYVHVCSLDKGGLVADGVLAHLTEVMGEKKALQVMIKVLKNGHLLRRLDRIRMTEGTSDKLLKNREYMQAYEIRVFGPSPDQIIIDRAGPRAGRGILGKYV